MRFTAFTEILDAKLKAVCPIFGVSVDDPADRTSWRIDFAPDATEAQKAGAMAVLGAFTPEAEDRPQIVSKLSIVDRLGDAELEIVLALRSGTAVTAVPLTAAEQSRLALRWDNAMEIDRLAADVRQGFAAVFGAARMEALLGS